MIFHVHYNFSLFTGLAMQAFSKSRNIDAQTICDLSMQNYVEVWYVLHIVFWELFIYS
jgi:hypothetical protein